MGIMDCVVSCVSDLVCVCECFSVCVYVSVIKWRELSTRKLIRQPLVVLRKGSQKVMCQGHNKCCFCRHWAAHR